MNRRRPTKGPRKSARSKKRRKTNRCPMRRARRLVYAVCAIRSLARLSRATEGGNCGDIDLVALVAGVTRAARLPERALFITQREDLSNAMIDLQYTAKTAGLARGEPSLPLPVHEVRV